MQIEFGVGCFFFVVRWFLRLLLNYVGKGFGANKFA